MRTCESSHSPCPGVRLRAADLAASTRDWDVRGGLMESNVLKMQEIEAGEMP